MTLYASLAEWVTGVRDWLDADHLTDAQVKAFINLAQDRLNRELAAWEMEATADRVAVSGAVTLPADFNRIRGVSISGTGVYFTSTKAELVKRAAEKDDTDRLFAIDAGAIILWPKPVDGTAVTIDYFVRVPELSATVSTNVFSNAYSDLLLWAALVEGSNFIVEDDRAALFEAKYQGALRAANENPKKVKVGSTPLRRMVRTL